MEHRALDEGAKELRSFRQVIRTQLERGTPSPADNWAESLAVLRRRLLPLTAK